MTLRITFIGCVASSSVALKTLLSLPEHCEVGGIMTMRSDRIQSDHVDLTDLAGRRTPLSYVEDMVGDVVQAVWQKALKPDLIFCVGWSRLLGNHVLRLHLAVWSGSVPATLPAKRGRHPLVVALALVLRQTSLPFFYWTRMATVGFCSAKLPVVINPEDEAASLNAQVLALLPRQVENIVRGLDEASLLPQPQDAPLSTCWRKRSADDGPINGPMESYAVQNLVRALARTYPGAHFMHQGPEAKVLKYIENPAGAPSADPGKVLAVDGRNIAVRSRQGSVILTDHELETLPAAGDYM